MEEEYESIRPREALIGLGLLGGLMALLVGVIFYRIINPTPRGPTSLEGLTIAAEVTDATPLATASLPAQGDGAVQPAGFAAETLPSAETSSPTFIAPSGR